MKTIIENKLYIARGRLYRIINDDEYNRLLIHDCDSDCRVAIVLYDWDRRDSKTRIGEKEKALLEVLRILTVLSEAR